MAPAPDSSPPPGTISLAIRATAAVSTEIYERLVDSITDYAIVGLDAAGHILCWNRGAQRIFGHMAHEILGRHVSLLYPPEDVDAGKPSRALQIAERDGRVGDEEWRVRSDGSRFMANVITTRFTDASGATAGFAVVTRDLTEGLESEVEHDRLLALEQKARAEAEQAKRARDDVLAIVVHDLRNPAHAIMSAASMLAIQAKEHRRQRSLDVILRSAREIDRLLSDLLDSARIEAGTFDIRRACTDVRTLLEQTVEQFEASALAQGIALRCEVPAGMPPISVDRERLSQVLSNLVSNALKFTPRGRSVSVRAAAANGFVQISVKDSGSGIPEADLAHVFDRYWQADRASRAGAGLGLTICKGIVEAHGGRIWVASAVSRGTTFHFTVPCHTD